MFKPLPHNDQTCGWLHGLPQRQASPALSGDAKADLVIIGAGYTGLSAAREYALLHPSKHVVLLDAQRAAEGASARNSGYLVDSTLNDGHLSDTGLLQYRQKYALNKVGVDTVEKLVNDHNIDCDWDACGKFHGAKQPKNFAKLERFSQLLAELGLNHKVYANDALAQRLSTHYYQMAVWTQGGVMLQPAKLGRAYIDILPANVSLYEHSPVLQWQQFGRKVRVVTPLGAVVSDQLLVAVNGFMASGKILPRRTFPLALTASMTRPLTDQEYQQIGSPAPWGMLSVSPMGATVRVTKDRRIMVRNTAEVWPQLNMQSESLYQRQQHHLTGLVRRFPQLPTNIFDSCWSGITCISRNNANVFARLSHQVYVAGCYNGGGIGLATLFGQQMAYLMSGETTDTMGMIQSRPQPARLPPQPLLNWGVRLRLARDRWLAGVES